MSKKVNTGSIPDPEDKNEDKNDKKETDSGDQGRPAGWERMSNRLFRILTNEILPLKTRHLKSEAEYMYRVGEVYAEILDQHAVYGNGDAELLAKALDCNRTTLDDYGHVAKAWPPEQFKELMERRFETKPGTLSFSHLIELASEKDEAERNGWVEKTLRHGWIVATLREKMKPRVEVEPAAEPMAEDDADLIELEELPVDQDDDDTPLTVRQAIIRTRGTLRNVVVVEEEWRERVIRPLSENPGHFGKPTRDELVSIRDVCDEVIGKVEAYRTQVDDLLNLTPEHALDDDDEKGGEGNG